MKSRSRASLLIAVVMLAGFQLPLGAQGGKAFEVASIRLKDPKISLRPSSRLTPTQFEWVSVTALDLLARACNARTFQIVAPEWARTERFEIRALLPSGASERDVPEMLQALLRRRFGLKAHVEPRPTQVYSLLVAPSGTTFREVPAVDDLRAKVDVSPGSLLVSDRVNGLPGDELREVLATGGSYRAITAQTNYSYRSVSPGGPRQLDAQRITMTQFTALLAQSLEHPVIDRTGLNGIYQFKTLLPPYTLPVASRARLADRLPTDPSGVDLSRSLAELGLKLELTTTPFDFVVVDQIERPTLD